jgi:hypothetical protein
MPVVEAVKLLRETKQSTAGSNPPKVHRTCIPRSGPHHPRRLCRRCCVIEDRAEGQTVIQIDDKELTMHEFGALLRVYAGWGMRISFVPEELIGEEPTLKVREPKRRQ